MDAILTCSEFIIFLNRPIQFENSVSLNWSLEFVSNWKVIAKQTAGGFRKYEKHESLMHKRHPQFSPQRLFQFCFLTRKHGFYFDSDMSGIVSFMLLRKQSIKKVHTKAHPTQTTI